MQNKKKWAYIALVLIVVIFIGINAKAIAQTLGFQKSAQVSLLVPVSNSIVYLDGKQFKTTSSDNQTVIIDGIAAGTPQTILVAKQNYWPWTKTVSLKAHQTLNLAAFNGYAAQVSADVPANVRAAATSALGDYRLPNPGNKIVSKDKNVAIWIQDNSIAAQWVPKSTPDDFFCAADSTCNRTETVFKGTTPITSVAFYKDRNDVLLLSTAGMIYALEIDQKGIQNFQPVYRGTDKNLTFAIGDDKSIYVKDGSKIMLLILQ